MSVSLQNIWNVIKQGFLFEKLEVFTLTFTKYFFSYYQVSNNYTVTTIYFVLPCTSCFVPFYTAKLLSLVQISPVKLL